MTRRLRKTDLHSLEIPLGEPNIMSSVYGEVIEKS